MHLKWNPSNLPELQASGFAVKRPKLVFHRDVYTSKPLLQTIQRAARAPEYFGQNIKGKCCLYMHSIFQDSFETFLYQSLKQLFELKEVWSVLRKKLPKKGTKWQHTTYLNTNLSRAQSTASIPPCNIGCQSVFSHISLPWSLESWEVFFQEHLPLEFGQTRNPFVWLHQT